MSMFHAIVWLDHHNAKVLQFNPDTVETATVKAHTHNTKQHGSGVRDEHEFFADVSAALAAITEVLVVGSTTAQSDFKHYLDKHRPQVAKQVVAYQTVDHPTDNQLVALAREFFLKHDRMAGVPTPG